MNKCVVSLMLIGMLSGLCFGANGDMGTTTNPTTNPNTNGSPEHPWLIEDMADFDEFCRDDSYWAEGVYTRLDCDLDLSSKGVHSQAPIASGIYVNYKFNGTQYAGSFDGNGHVISNFTINGVEYCGLFGYVDNSGSILNLGVENVSITGSGKYVGALVGVNTGSISSSYSTCSVTGDRSIGGLVGEHYGSISNCYSSGSVEGDNYVGGLVGTNIGSITNSYSTGSVIGSGNSVGGLVGYNASSVTNSYSTGSVTGLDSSVGGLVGKNNGNVTGSYSTGSVTASKGLVGGLVGNNKGSVSNSYSTGSVDGQYSIGGLVGRNDNGSITSCYSAGLVTGNDYLGGLCGYQFGNNAETIDCFWDYQTSDRTLGYHLFSSEPGTVTNVTGLPTLQMQMESTFVNAGWDFSTMWFVYKGKGYPRLLWQWVSSPCHGQKEVSIHEDLQWSSDNTAVSYDVYFGTDNPPTVLLANDITEVTFDPGMLLSGTTYYWQVVINTVVEEIPGYVWQFTTADNKAAAPQPVDGQGSISVNSSLSWLPATDAVSYDVYFGTDNPPATLVANDIKAPTCVPGTMLSNTTYYWQVVVNVGLEEIAGDVWQFTTVNNKVAGAQPFNGQGGVSINTDVSWSPVADALSYDVYFGTDNPLATLIADDVTDLTFDPGTMLTNTTYYWRVNVNTGAEEVFGDVWQFTTGTIDDIGGPQPTDGQVKVNNNAVLSWTPVAEAVSYDVFWGTDNPPTVLLADDITNVTCDPGVLLTGTTYYWQVVVNTGVENIPGDLWQFTTFNLAGDGTSGNPYVIKDMIGFDEFCEDESYWAEGVHIRLDSDLDLSSKGTYSRAPIAGSTNLYSSFVGTEYSGSFDGNGHTISHLTVNGKNYNGLFGKIDAAGSITNLRVENVSITSPSSVINSAVYIGGLCGYNDGAISNCYTTGAVIGGDGSDWLGGLCGSNYGTIGNCHATAAVIGGEYSQCLGGLCGLNPGTISDCYATGAVTGDDNADYLGGLCGNSSGQISDCHANGSVREGSTLGGLCGKNSGTINDCYATGTTKGWSYLGGLCGTNSGTINDCHATGAVNGVYISNYIGGLCGNNSNTINDCYATGAVTGGHFDDILGGLCGKNSGTISDCYAAGAVTGGMSSRYLGGLCGRNSNAINNCYAIGAVTSEHGSGYVGGLCGQNDSGTINNCYVISAVTCGDYSDYLGGLCGQNGSGTISNSYAVGAVKGEYNSDYLGGLCGHNVSGTISNCYSTGSVSKGSYSTHSRGFCGYNDTGTIEKCFWDVETSRHSSSIYGAIGKSTAQMQMRSTFVDAGWDFTDIWWMRDGHDSPRLYWQALPYGGQKAIGINEDLYWMPVADALSYDIYFGLDNPPELLLADDITESTFDPGTLLGNASYYWQLVANTAAGEVPGKLWHFKTSAIEITGEQPRDRWPGMSIETDVSWLPVADALSYGLYFGVDNPPTTLAADDISEAIYDPGMLLSNTTYYWQVIVNTGAEGIAGEVWYFKTKECKAQEPEPYNGQIHILLDSNLAWAPVAEAVSYDVYFGTDDPPATLIADDITKTTCDPGTMSSETSYYWQVVVNTGIEDVPGDIWHFRTADCKADNVKPWDGDEFISLEPDVSWAPVPGAVSYDVYFGTDNPPTALLADDIANLTYNPGILYSNTTYYWRVNTNMKLEEVEGDLWQFTTTDGRTVNPQPTHELSTASMSADLTWDVFPGAVSYDVYFGTDDPPATRVADDTMITAYDLGTLLSRTTYYWRVDVKTALEEITGNVLQFTTTDGKAVGLQPADGQILFHNNPDLSWTADAAAISFDLYLGTTNPPDALVADNITESTFETGVLNNESTYYWQVIVNTGIEQIDSDVWQFTTGKVMGNGSANNPYIIANLADFDEFANADNSDIYWAQGVHTRLACDIDLSGRVYDSAVIGADIDTYSFTFDGISFEGVFDGDDHIVQNLTINAEGTGNDYLGLFGKIEGDNAAIKNLGVENVNITGDRVPGDKGSTDIGGLCGQNYDGTIANCYATGSIIAEKSAGGLCGWNYGIISNCYAACSVVGGGSGFGSLGGFCGGGGGTIINCYATGEVSGERFIGGLCGNVGGTITNCYSNSTVTGTEYLGGLCGGTSAEINHCYAAGKVNAAEGAVYAGGLCGKIYNATMAGCFWDVESSGMGDGVGSADPDSAGVVGKTTAQMQTLSTFTTAGWDFDPYDGAPANWIMSLGDYPRLAWEDRLVNLEEFALLCQYWQITDCTTGQPCSQVDWYTDGKIDLLDLNQLALSWLGEAMITDSPPVGLKDFSQLSQYWQMTDCTDGQPCDQVDWYNDDTIDIHDLYLLSLNWLGDFNDLQAYKLSPTGRWRFDETSGTTATDSSAGGNDGTLQNGGTWQPASGQIGGALALDGVDDMVELPGEILDPSRSFSVMLWVKLDEKLGTGSQVILQQEGATGRTLLYRRAGDDKLGSYFGSTP